MAKHTSTVVWQRDQESFVQRRYSRRHTWEFDGGLSLPASSSPHVVPMPFSDPAAIDPEEAFVAALSSCHMLWFLDLAAQAGWTVDDYRDAAVGTMARDMSGRITMTQVTLRPEARFSGQRLPTQTEVQDLHHKAHEECYLANSVKTEILCEPVFGPVHAEKA